MVAVGFAFAKPISHGMGMPFIILYGRAGWMTSPGPFGSSLVARERWVYRQRTSLPGHTGRVLAVAWGQLGGQPVLASGSDDNTRST